MSRTGFGEDAVPLVRWSRVFLTQDPDGLPDDVIDELLAGARTPEEIAGPDKLLQRLTKRLVERAMAAELSEHLGYERGEAPPGGVGNARNGMTPKTVHKQDLARGLGARHPLPRLSARRVVYTTDEIVKPPGAPPVVESGRARVTPDRRAGQGMQAAPRRIAA